MGQFQLRTIGALISVFVLTSLANHGFKGTSLLGLSSQVVSSSPSQLVSVTPTKGVRVTSDTNLLSPSPVAVTSDTNSDSNNTGIETSGDSSGPVVTSLETMTPDSFVTNKPNSALSPSPSTETPTSDQAQAAKININTATLAELETLNGIGSTLAGRIVDYRQSSGPFKTIEDIMKVKGIKQGIFDKIKDQITV